ncbi:MAG: hypothetical protein LKE64_07770 [Solobacterium sp.]|jgi:hypothetical protein|nr:hypothetical protein [Solobacterium sp.]MCH4048870.1 hypothetical protein [Solobacterium sp.]MCH4074376.1 hypothetical protein [Solobacterium sp.]MCI1313941.1 hypothetical protein [Solobacterium sp.]MCI1346060.1 hypothetical protein [Solobacterium sp.]
MACAEDYKKIINFKKQEFQVNGWNALDIKAELLLKSVSGAEEDLPAVIEAMSECMLEGDQFLNDTGIENRVRPDLTVRYYCDNLSESRRKYQM